MTDKPLYITTTLPYVNADPHIGFAFELVQADILARYARAVGRAVFFNTGTDEHGQKIFEKACEAGEPVEEYVAHYAGRFEELGQTLHISNDAFIRTTDEAHKKAAGELWRRCDAAGDIYTDTFEGLYCVGCEKYLTERDLAGGRCPLHPDRVPEQVKEENYFFRFAKYTNQLRDYVKEGVIVPQSRRKEALQFIDDGLTDFSISRRRERLSWGVPVPDDDEQVMYVWFDALTNYISTLGWPADTEGRFETFWQDGETIQLAGKDQIRFQSLMWTAMLMSAGLPTTNRVVYHGFINSGGHKMSKSLGNVVDPFAVVEKYGTDALRYFLARHIHPFEDSDYTDERMKEAYNAHLANGLGNVVSRILAMAQEHLGAPVALPPSEPLPQTYRSALERHDFNSAGDVVWEHVALLDERIEKTQPFKLIKENASQARVIIEELVIELARIVEMLKPFLPDTAEKIKRAIRENKKPETLFPRID